MDDNPLLQLNMAFSSIETKMELLEQSANANHLEN
jgi:hypothetical protein